MSDAQKQTTEPTLPDIVEWLRDSARNVGLSNPLGIITAFRLTDAADEIERLREEKLWR